MRNQILQGDVLEMLATLLAESVNCIITSPPYFGLRNYGLPPTHWPEVSYAPMAGLPEITIPPMACCLGLEDTIEAYVGHMVLVWRGLWRVLRGDGVGWLNLGDSYAGSWGNYGGQNRGNGKQREIVNGSKIHQKSYDGLENWRPPTANALPPKNLIGIPWRCAFALQADGWYLRSDVIWAKKNPMPESVRDRPTKAHEYLFLLAKSERYWWDQEAIREENISVDRDREKNNGESSVDTKRRGFGSHCGTYSQGRNKRTVWELSSQPLKAAHFAVMPEALVEPCLLAGCPAQVCAECGEPWVRVVEREVDNLGEFRNQNSIAVPPGNPSNRTLINGTVPSYKPPSTKTIAHTPTCQHSAPTRPGIALDPFFGSGTVGVVAKKFKRDWSGIELNPDYAEMARNRLSQTQPALFAR